MNLLTKERKFDALFLGDYNELKNSLIGNHASDLTYNEFYPIYKMLIELSGEEYHYEDLVSFTKFDERISDDMSNFFDDIIYELSKPFCYWQDNERQGRTYVFRKFNGFIYCVSKVRRKDETYYDVVYVFKQNLTEEFKEALGVN